MRGYYPTLKWDSKVQGYFEKAFGVAKLEAISQRLCVPSLKPTLRVNHLRISTEDALLALHQALPAAALQPYAHPLVPGMLVVPGTGPRTDIDFQASGKEVMINRLAGESVLKGSDIFAPGILACTKGVVPGDWVAVSIAVPEGSSSSSSSSSSSLGSSSCSGKSGRGKDARFVLNRGCTISEANQHLLPAREHLYVGVGRALMSRKEMFRSSSGLAVAMSQRVFDIPPCNGLLRGQMMLQAMPSFVAAQALAPAPGSRVLDMCASPGGKTTALAQLMDDSGEIVALDRTEAKVAQVRALAADLGITCITAIKLDATRCLVSQQLEDAAMVLPGGGPAGIAEQESHANQHHHHHHQQQQQQQQQQQSSQAAHRYSGGLEPGSFDYVLLDPPCSALGLRPRLMHDNISLEQLRKVASYQRAMIHNAVELLRPGGELVLCTCTINPGENEGNVNYITSRFPSMRLVEQPLHIAQPGLTPLSSSAASSEVSELWLQPRDAELVQRFCPADPELDCMGFFISKFVKRA